MPKTYSKGSNNVKGGQGYRLFVHIFALFWQQTPVETKDDLLLIFGGRRFLGVVAKVWQQHNVMQKARWGEMAAERSGMVVHYSDRQLLSEIEQMVDNIVTRLRG